MMQKIKKAAPAVAKLLLFVFLFLAIYNYTSDAFIGSNLNNALPLLAEQPDESYDVILAGSSHMQLAIHPAQLFAEYGIAACNTASASQSIPTSYFIIKEMIERHSPELVVLDLFSINGDAHYFTRAWVHEALDGFRLSPNKIVAINSLVEDEREEFYFPYYFYHARWKELEETDYKYELKMNEGYQFSVDRIVPMEGDFAPLDPEQTSEIPEITLEYLEKIIDLCKKTDTKLLFTVAPYRADRDLHENVSAVQLQGRYNAAAKLAQEHGVDYFNSLWYLEEMDFDFTEGLADAIHLNAIGSEKASRYYGQYLRDNYDLPDRSQDENFSHWHGESQEYLRVLEERKALCLEYEDQ